MFKERNPNVDKGNHNYVGGILVLTRSREENPNVEENVDDEWEIQMCGG